jgi:SAM-dependent methyltransferase
MFQQSLKKQLKLQSLLQMIGTISPDQTCLLVTCGDNNGALNWHFRAHGGQWQWADIEPDNIREMSTFLGEPVHHTSDNQLPFSDNQFDRVVAIDVLEHLDNDQPFLSELGRVVRNAGKILITVPNGDPNLLANRLKWRLGMTPEVYGHTRAGYTLPQLAAQIQQANLRPIAEGGYSRFFTEIIELTINYGYVFMLSRKKNGKIAPTSSNELKTHGMAYKLYSLAFPILRLFSRLDGIMPASNNHAVTILATKT